MIIVEDSSRGVMHNFFLQLNLTASDYCVFSFSCDILIITRFVFHESHQAIRGWEGDDRVFSLKHVTFSIVKYSQFNI